MGSTATKQMSVEEVGVFCCVCGWWNDGLSDVCKDCDSRLIDERPLGGHAIGDWLERQVGQRDILGIPTAASEVNVLREWVVGVPVLPNVKDAGNASISGSDTRVHRHDTDAAKSGRSETWKVLLYVSLTIVAVVAVYAAIGFGLFTAPSPSTSQDRQSEYAETVYPSMLVIAEAPGDSGLDMCGTDGRSTA